MTSVTPQVIEVAFQQASLFPLPSAGYENLAVYFDILERWNPRLNLTALRRPDEILQRHFVECAFVAQMLPPGILTLMDFGSGAGFPGMVIAICRPKIRVTLVEAHTKKAAFLREVVRVLGLPVDVFASRVEDMPWGLQFDAVTMRAVDKMELAIPVAHQRARAYLVLLTTRLLAARYREEFRELAFHDDVPFPGTEQQVLAFAVPRGTTR